MHHPGFRQACLARADALQQSRGATAVKCEPAAGDGWARTAGVGTLIPGSYKHPHEHGQVLWGLHDQRDLVPECFYIDSQAADRRVGFFPFTKSIWAVSVAFYLLWTPNQLWHILKSKQVPICLFRYINTFKNLAHSILYFLLCKIDEDGSERIWLIPNDEERYEDYLGTKKNHVHEIAVKSFTQIRWSAVTTMGIFLLPATPLLTYAGTPG